MADRPPAKKKRPAEADDVDGALARVDRARIARERAEQAESEAVTAARDAGHSWSQIGRLYGLTKQGAQQRFRHRPSDGTAETSSAPRRRARGPERPPADGS